MNVGSLFSGIGGIEIGFHKQGFNTAWFVEMDQFCQKILRKNFPTVPIYSDVRKANWIEMPKIEILTGGFPCQDISKAGTGKGIKGKRSCLWKHYAEAIRILRPKYAVIENVSTITRRGLDVVLKDLAEIGYDAEWIDLRASDFKAPHKRERLFIIAYPNSGGCHQERFGILAPAMEKWNKSTNMSSEIENENWWSCEPELGRVVHGIPSELDKSRNKTLGNAVVPVVAEFVAKTIWEAENC